VTVKSPLPLGEGQGEGPATNFVSPRAAEESHGLRIDPNRIGTPVAHVILRYARHDSAPVRRPAAAQASTFTPFQNATWSAMLAAAAEGSG
jgi:hypothetical protein